MAMAIDSRQQAQLNSMGYDHLRYPQSPHFTNPWASAPPPHQQLYSSAVTPNVPAAIEHVQRPTSIALSFHSLTVTAPPIGQGIALVDGNYSCGNLPETSQGFLSRNYGGAYASTAPQVTPVYAPTSAPYSQAEYSNVERDSYAYPQDGSRRSSQPSVPPTTIRAPVDFDPPRQDSCIDFDRLNPQPARNSFTEALDASRGMISLSQSDITPRNIYGSTGTSRSSMESYGFPSTHSAHSSISSTSYGGYYGGEGSVTDYSSASESVDIPHSRTLPRPSALLGASIPPSPQSMMSQFSSKVSSGSQKKHKCKICDKRFTRPSSLQTHMYSHTGEQPFVCEVEGCGRHFSVVSNLRRHRKVHKNEGTHDHPSPEDV